MTEDFDSKLAAAHESGPFYYYFGQFIQLFAMVESNFHSFFDHISGVELSVSRALVGGEQLKKLSSVCNRIVQNGQWDNERKAEFQGLINQLNMIADFRHTLVHRGVENITGELKSSNMLTAKSVESVEILRFNLSHIRDAIEDMKKLLFTLTVIRLPQVREVLAPDVLRQLDHPWRYKRIVPDKLSLPPRKDGQ